MSSVFNTASALRVMELAPNDDKIRARLQSRIDAYLSAVDTAAASGSANELAVKMYCEKNPDSKDTRVLADGGDAIAQLRATIDEAKAKIDKVKETIAAVRAKAIDVMGDAAKLSYSTVTANLGATLRDTHNELTQALAFMGIELEDVTFPRTIAGARGKSEGKGSTGTVRLRLASAAVDGETVSPAEGKDYVTVTDIAKVVGVKSHELSAAILSASNGDRDFTDLSVTVGEHAVTVTARES